MKVLIIVLVIVVVLALIGLAMAVRIVKQYEEGVLFRFGRVQGPRAPGLRLIIPFADVLRRVSLRIVTMPIHPQGIITRDNVSVDVSAVAYFRVVDAVESVIAIEDVELGHRPDRADHPAEGGGPAQPGPRPSRRPTRSIWTSARSWTSPPSRGAWRSRWSS